MRLLHRCFVNLAISTTVVAFTAMAPSPRGFPQFHMASSDSSTTEALDSEVRSMRVRELKEELSKLDVSSQDVFEKEELVQRLLKARRNAGASATSTSEVPKSSTPSSPTTTTITAPLYFTNLDTNLNVAAVNMDGGITINPSDQPYATLQLTVTRAGSNLKTPCQLNLLVDTACSSFVLRPSVVEKFQLPKLKTPVTMTGAGGTTSAMGLTQLDAFELVAGSTKQSFGPLPAAVQDIGALPSSLDGILGLSFLSQFATVDFDFQKGQVTFYSSLDDVPKDLDKSLVAKGSMERLPQLGIYAVDVMLGARGPVKMLVDSGAAHTFLDWHGVTSLGLSRKEHEGTALKRLTQATGAMGSDNVAMQLTHRIHVSSVLQLMGSKDLPGVSLKEESNKRLAVDVGDVAILKAVRAQNVGGILGMDALMRCAMVRMSFGSAVPKEICFYE